MIPSSSFIGHKKGFTIFFCDLLSDSDSEFGDSKRPPLNGTVILADDRFNPADKALDPSVVGHTDAKFHKAVIPHFDVV